jgi:DNA-nicking Smr family endonuclease
VSGKKRELTADEAKLWRSVVAAVKKARPGGDRGGAPATPKTERTASGAASAAARQGRRADAATKGPADRGGERRIRRGKVDVGAVLDLHGHTQASARLALARFLRAAQARGDRVVIVITGAGRDREGVLKRRLPEWLAEEELRSIASGYAQAHRAHGGAGAFYVFLKRGR